MKKIWKKQEIEKALRQMAKAAPEDGVFDRVWYKLEDRIHARNSHFWQHVIWKPWGHPVRWVAAACLCLTLSGTFYIQNLNNENKDMAEYLMAISNPAANVTHDLGIVNVSVLLSGPSTNGVELLKADDEHSNILPGDEIFL
jgi:hypothetical protein